jgi:hypothetical protein
VREGRSSSVGGSVPGAPPSATQQRETGPAAERRGTGRRGCGMKTRPATLAATIEPELAAPAGESEPLNPSAVERETAKEIGGGAQKRAGVEETQHEDNRTGKDPPRVRRKNERPAAAQRSAIAAETGSVTRRENREAPGGAHATQRKWGKQDTSGGARWENPREATAARCGRTD